MRIKYYFVLLLTLIMLLAVVGPVAAQDGDDPVGDPPTGEPADGEDEDVGFTHPIVILLDSYFGDTGDSDTPDDPTDPPDPADPPDPGDPTDPGDDDGEEMSVGEQIAAYHEDGMGFGVLVKFYAIATESGEACENADGDCNISVEHLVEEFNDGAGLGNIMKDYGKPSMLGIGHVRQELKEKEAEEAQAAYEEATGKTNNGNNSSNDQANGKDKDKENNGNGNDKDKENNGNDGGNGNDKKK